MQVNRLGASCWPAWTEVCAVSVKDFGDILWFTKVNRWSPNQISKNVVKNSMLEKKPILFQTTQESLQKFCDNVVNCIFKRNCRVAKLWIVAAYLYYARCLSEEFRQMVPHSTWPQTLIANRDAKVGASLWFLMLQESAEKQGSIATLLLFQEKRIFQNQWHMLLYF